MLALGDAEPGAWRPPIVRTQATTGRGVPELLAAIEAFQAHTAPARRERRRVRHEFRLRELLADRFMEHVDRHVLAPGELDDVLGRIAERGLDPYTAANGILERALGRDRTVNATLDHIGIAVGDLSQALAFTDALGLDVEPPEVPSQRVRALGARRRGDKSNCSSRRPRIRRSRSSSESAPRRAPRHAARRRHPRDTRPPQGARDPPHRRGPAGAEAR
jgi:hypothetical protein